MYLNIFYLRRLYHLTDIRSVDSILEGRQYIMAESSVFDFSPGFYLTNSIEYVLYLAEEKRNNDLALIVYDLPEKFFAEFYGLKLQTDSNKDLSTWRMLTLSCLKPPHRRPSQFAYIEGPLVSGSLQVSRCSTQTPVFLNLFGETPIQIAILSGQMNFAMHLQATITVFYLLPHL